MPDLRLTSMEPETEPPAPLPFPSRTWREAGTTDPANLDAVVVAERALDRAQSAMDTLAELVGEECGPIPFPGRDTSGDDDGPWAA